MNYSARHSARHHSVARPKFSNPSWSTNGCGQTFGSTGSFTDETPCIEPAILSGARPTFCRHGSGCLVHCGAGLIWLWSRWPDGSGGMLRPSHWACQACQPCPVSGRASRTATVRMVPPAAHPARECLAIGSFLVCLRHGRVVFGWCAGVTAGTPDVMLGSREAVSSESPTSGLSG